MSSLCWKSTGFGTEVGSAVCKGTEVGKGNELRCPISEGVVDEEDRLDEEGSID